MLESGTLWQKILERTETALRCGALEPIATNYEFIEQDGISFLVRILSNLDRKEKAKKQQQKTVRDKDFNPFLPYEKDLFVTNLSDTHLCLLNKYNVVDNHILIVTKEFEEQDNWLTVRDFEAMHSVLAEFDGLAFYNGGTKAGSSQRHKHLQVVPVPFTASDIKIPLETAIDTAVFNDGIGKISLFPFLHALIKLEPNFGSIQDRAEKTFHCYETLLRSVGLIEDRIIEQKQSDAYNFLAIQEWMLIVPRTVESFRSISINALGFAGALLVCDREQLVIVKKYQPIEILKNVSKML